MSRTFQQYKSNDEPVPGYRLIRFLGKGNFGEVWMASAPGNKKVALKIIDLRGREGLQESKAIERIKDINHAHLVSIFAYWLVDAEGGILSDQLISQVSPDSSVAGGPGSAVGGTLFVDPAMQTRPVELIVAMSLGSKNLSDLLDEHRQQQKIGIPIESLLDYMDEAAKGLDYLNSPIHDLGKGPRSIIHGNVKPQNLLIVGDSLQICDFGLARSIDELRRTATAMGSFAYAAPELLEGHPHVRSDQYCLAVTYIELRTGDLPLFGETNILKIAEMHRGGRLNLSGLGPRETEVIRKATNPDPQQRWPSCRELARALRAAVVLDAAGESSAEPLEESYAIGTRKFTAAGTAMTRKPAPHGTRRFIVGAALVLLVSALAAAAVWRDQWIKLIHREEVPPVVAKREEPPPRIVEHVEKPAPVIEHVEKPPLVDDAAKSPVVKPVDKPPIEKPREKPAVVKPVDVSPLVDYGAAAECSEISRHAIGGREVAGDGACGLSEETARQGP